MESSIYLFMSILIFASAIYLLHLQKNSTVEKLDDSEFHASTRYSIAEKINKEFEERNHHNI